MQLKKIRLRKKQGYLPVRRLYRKWLLLFAGSFLTGILLLLLWFKATGTAQAVQQMQELQRIAGIEFENADFFGYVLAQRFKSVGWLLLFSTTLFGLFVSHAFIALQGLLLGMMTAQFLAAGGLKGGLLLFALLFPHQLLLIPAGFLLAGWCYQTCSILYYPGKKIDTLGEYYYRNKKKQWLRQAGLLLWICLMFLAGCFLEGFVSPLITVDVIRLALSYS